MIVEISFSGLGCMGGRRDDTLVCLVLWQRVKWKTQLTTFHRDLNNRAQKIVTELLITHSGENCKPTATKSCCFLLS